MTQRGNIIGVSIISASEERRAASFVGMASERIRNISAIIIAASIIASTTGGGLTCVHSSY